MNKNISVENLLKLLPPYILKDKYYRALAVATAKELYKIYLESYKTVIYANIDNLGEGILDILALDFNVAWYDPNYPIDVKREMIKNNITVHKKMGTKKAVERALGNLHPNTTIEEWYNYGGDPFYFRVILETTKSRVTAELDEIKKTIEYYKRKSAELDGIVYQNSIFLEAITSLETYIYNTGLTGQVLTGTIPDRASKGVRNDYKISSNTKAEGYIFNNNLCGQNICGRR